jgi:PAS domain S-box-containing protein
MTVGKRISDFGTKTGNFQEIQALKAIKTRIAKDFPNLGSSMEKVANIVLEKMCKSEEKYRALIDASPHYFLLIDSERRIVDLNRKTADLFASSSVDIKGMHVAELGSEFSLKLDEICEKLVHKFDDNQQLSSAMEVLIEHKDEKSMWLGLDAIPLVIEGNKYIQIVGNDITAQKQAEELANKELEAIAALDRAKSEFIDRASHELNTPLTSICGAASILSEYSSLMSEKERELLEIIKRGGERLSHIVEIIVNSLQLESNVLEIKRESIDLIDLIKRIIDQHEFLLKLRGHSIIFKSTPVPNIFGDREKLEDVISNLIINAINNTPSHGEIRVMVEIIDDHVDLSVADTGVGLTEEEKSKIFIKFGKIERYGQGLDIVADGSGLGLYFAKKVIELHEGTIRVESEGRNKGSKFIVCLPLYGSYL